MAHKFLRHGLPLAQLRSRVTTGVRRFASGGLMQQIQRSEKKGAKMLGLAGAVGIASLMGYGLSRPQNFESSQTREIIRQYGYASGYVQKRIASTYGYVTAGLGLTAATAMVFFSRGYAARVAAMNPWVVMLGSMGGLMVTGGMARSIDPDQNPAMKHLAWFGFQAIVALMMAPLGALGGQIVKQAAMTTGMVVGSLSAVAMCAPDDTFLKMGPMLGVGFGCVMAASLGSIVFPASPMLYNIVMYGGLGLFGLYLAYDTQKMLHNAEVFEHFDAMGESLGIYMNTIQIFWRIALIMANNRKR